mgnify:CR=1 FL=1
MTHPSTTVPIDFVRQLLDRPNLDDHARRACLAHAGIPADLLASRQARASMGNTDLLQLEALQARQENLAYEVGLVYERCRQEPAPSARLQFDEPRGDVRHTG